MENQWYGFHGGMRVWIWWRGGIFQNITVADWHQGGKFFLLVQVFWRFLGCLVSWAIHFHVFTDIYLLTYISEGFLISFIFWHHIEYCSRWSNYVIYFCFNCSSILEFVIIQLVKLCLVLLCYTKKRLWYKITSKWYYREQTEL